MKPQHHLFATTVLCALVLLSCKQDTSLPEPDPIPNRNPIRFDQLAVGQISQYLYLWGEYYQSMENNHFGYLDDTLQLKIVGQNDQGFEVEETLHYVGDVPIYFNATKDSVYRYYLKIEGHNLFIRKNNQPYLHSRIFEFNTSMVGWWLPNFGGLEVEILGWKTSLGYVSGRRTGYTKSYTLFGQTYPRLNVLVENSPMSYDGMGETYVYSRTSGIVRFSRYSLSKGYGWDLLP